MIIMIEHSKNEKKKIPVFCWIGDEYMLTLDWLMPDGKLHRLNVGKNNTAESLSIYAKLEM